MKTLDQKLIDVLFVVAGIVALAGACVAKHMDLGFCLIAVAGIIYESIIIRIAIKYVIPYYPKRKKILALDIFGIVCLVATIAATVFKGWHTSIEIGVCIVTVLAMFDAVNARDFMVSLLRSRYLAKQNKID